MIGLTRPCCSVIACVVLQENKTALYWAVEKGNATMVRDILQCNPDTENCTKVPPVCLSASLSVCLSASLSVCLSACLSRICVHCNSLSLSLSLSRTERLL